MTTFIQSIDKKILFAVLALLMLLSRPYPLSGIVHLADATNAIFFLGGLMALPAAAFAGFAALAVAIDAVVVYGFGTGAFCVSPAYGFLLPAFALLWFGGRAMAGEIASPTRAAKVLAVFLLLQVAAHSLTSGSFYAFSGRFAEPTLAGLLERTAQYLPGYVVGALWYVALFVGLQYALHWAVRERSEA